MKEASKQMMEEHTRSLENQMAEKKMQIGGANINSNRLSGKRSSQQSMNKGIRNTPAGDYTSSNSNRKPPQMPMTDQQMQIVLEDKENSPSDMNDIQTQLQMADKELEVSHNLIQKAANSLH